MICLVHEGCPASYLGVYPHALSVTTKNVPGRQSHLQGRTTAGDSQLLHWKIGNVDHNIIKPFFFLLLTPMGSPIILWERHVTQHHLTMEPAFQSEQAPVNHCCTSVSSFPCPRKFQVNFQPSCYNFSRRKQSFPDFAFSSSAT